MFRLCNLGCGTTNRPFVLPLTRTPRCDENVERAERPDENSALVQPNQRDTTELR
jgi:hypothetical protein